MSDTMTMKERQTEIKNLYTNPTVIEYNQLLKTENRALERNEIIALLMLEGHVFPPVENVKELSESAVVFGGNDFSFYRKDEAPTNIPLYLFSVG